MVPARPAADKSLLGWLRRVWLPLRRTGRPAAVGLLLWGLAVALPWLELASSDPALQRRAVRWLVFLPPLALAWAAMQATPWVVLATACLGALPALIAAPALAEVNATPLRASALAVALGLLVASAADRDPEAAPLRQLWRWPRAPQDQLRWALLGCYLGAAWLPGASSARVAAAAALWMAVHALPIGARPDAAARQRGRWFLARALWLLLILIALALRPESP